MNNTIEISGTHFFAMMQMLMLMLTVNRPLASTLVAASASMPKLGIAVVMLMLEGLATVNICISDFDVASKWVPLISMALLTLSDAKHQRKKS